MQSNTIVPIKLMFTSLLIFIAGCTNSVKVIDRITFCQVMKTQMLCLDSLRTSGIEGYEKLDSVNRHIRYLIEQYRNGIAATADTAFEGVEIVTAADKKLSLVSWDMRTGGTMPALAAMAVFRTAGEKVHTEFLVDSLFGERGLSMIAYRGLYVIKGIHGAVYVALGYGRGSTILPWQQLKSFAIKEERLVYPPVFPGRASTWLVEFDRTHLNGQELPEIKVAGKGYTILVPESSASGGFGGVIKKLVFKDSVYQIAD